MLPLLLLSSLNLLFLGTSRESERDFQNEESKSRLSCNESESKNWYSHDNLQATLHNWNIGNNALPTCMNVTMSINSVIYLDNRGVILQIGHKRGQLIIDYNLWPDRRKVDFCYPLSPQMLHCPLRSVNPPCYEINTTDNVLRLHDSKVVYHLGDYYLDARGTAVLCSVPINPWKHVPRCKSMILQPGDYTKMPNGTLRMRGPMSLRPSEYTMSSTGVVNACYPLSIGLLNCPEDLRYTINEDVSDMQEDHRLFYRIHDYFIDIGEYYRPKNNREYVVCLDEPIMDGMRSVLKIFTAFKCMSVICLLLTISYQLLEPKLNTYSKCLLAHNICITIHFIAKLIKELTLNHERNPALCYVNFYLGYFSGVAAFTWLNISAFDLWYSLAYLQSPAITNKKNIFKYYILTATGLPVLLCIVLGILRDMESTLYTVFKYPMLTTKCSLHDYTINSIFQYGFILLSSTLNGIFYTLTLLTINSSNRQVENIINMRKKKNSNMVMLCIKLSVVMGLCWIVDGIMWNIQKFISFPYWYISYPLVTIQGVAILLVVVCRRSAYVLIRTHYNYKIRLKCHKLLQAPRSATAADLYD